MSGSFVVKKQAREFLKGNWGVLIAAVFAIFIPIMISDCIEICIPFLGMDRIGVRGFIKAFEEMPLNAAVCFLIEMLRIICIVLFLPLITGIKKASLKIAGGERARFSDVLYYFSSGRYFDALSFNILLTAKKLLWAFVSFCPAIICISFSSYFAASGTKNAFLSNCLLTAGILLAACGIIIYFCLTAKYFLAQYLFIEADKNTSHMQIIKISALYMKNNMKKYLQLLASFVPWLLLCFFFLPLLYAAPYMLVSFANSAKWIIKIEQENSAVQSFTDLHGGEQINAQNAFGGV